MLLTCRSKMPSTPRSSSRFKTLWKLAITLVLITLISSLALNKELQMSMGNFYALKLNQGSNYSYANIVLSSLGFSVSSKRRGSLIKLSQFGSEDLENEDSAEDSFDDSQFQIYDTFRHQPRPDRNSPDGISAITDNQFLVNTAGCKIPDFNPFHPSVKAYLSAPPKISCRTSGIGDVTTSSRNILFFHPEKLPLENYLKFIKNSTSSQTKYHLSYAKVTFPDQAKAIALQLKEPADDLAKDVMNAYAGSSINCCFRSIVRTTETDGKLKSGFDGSFKYSENCHDITQEQTIVRHDCIVVFCNASSNIIYKNVHHFIQTDKYSKSDVAETQTLQSVNNGNKKPVMSHNISKKQSKKQSDSLSVIIFGTDSVSRLNFLRKLPKSYKFLMENLEALEFRGFNKLGDNTFPNLIPILTGLSSEQLKNHSCLPTVGPKVFDKCPFIWKSFKRKGYTTAFMEDSPWMGIFNYNHPGFINPPTDHYGRSYFLASEKLIGRAHKGNSNVCQGNKLSMQILQNYSLEFMQAYPDLPTFSLFWSASITHDFVNFASLADDPHAAYLNSLEEMGALNQSVLIFMSDHGMRWGKLRKTHLGALEERLPFFFIVLPKWFKDSYPAAVSNLEKNTKSLVSNFDVHETLLDLVNKKYEDEVYVKSNAGTDLRGISLFKEIPKNRTCSDAGIPQHFCTCQEMKEIDKGDKAVEKAKNYTMNFINKELEMYENCSIFTNTSVLSSSISIWNGQRPPSSSSHQDPPYRTLFLQLKLDPGNAIIEATIKDENLQISDQPFEILGEVSRINVYGNQSHCIVHDVLRKFCICKDTLAVRSEDNV